MAPRVNRAEIWLSGPARSSAGAGPSRPSLIAVLHTVTVVAITSTRRGSPTEVDLDVEDGTRGRVLRKPV